MIGLVAYVMLTAAFSKQRLKILAVSLAIAPVLWVSMDERMQNRYLTIIDPSKGPANAQASAEGRWEGLKTGLMLFQKSPIYGVGPGQSQYYTLTQLQTHNFLGQVAGELGGAGLLAFAFLSTCIFINYLVSRFLLRIYQRIDANGEDYLHLVSLSVFIALILLLLLGFGSHNAFRYTWIWFAAFQGFAIESLYKKTSDAAVAYAAQEHTIDMAKAETRLRKINA